MCGSLAAEGQVCCAAESHGSGQSACEWMEMQQGSYKTGVTWCLIMLPWRQYYITTFLTVVDPGRDFPIHKCQWPPCVHPECFWLHNILWIQGSTDLNKQWGMSSLIHAVLENPMNVTQKGKGLYSYIHGCYCHSKADIKHIANCWQCRQQHTNAWDASVWSFPSSMISSYVWTYVVFTVYLNRKPPVVCMLMNLPTYVLELLTYIYTEAQQPCMHKIWLRLTLT